MSISYANLVTTIKRYVEDDSPDFTQNLSRIIKQAEGRIYNDLNFHIFDKSQTGTVSGSFITLPSDAVSVEFVSVEDVQLMPRGDAYVADYGGTGQPLYYCMRTTGQLRIAPNPIGTVAWALKYRAPPDGLSNSTTTTWISSNLSEALIYACLMESEAYLKADERLPIWTQAYADAIQKFKDQHPEHARKVYP